MNTNRQTPCDVCSCEVVEIKVSNQEFNDGSIDEIYEERCIECGNLLYGWVKRVRGSRIAIVGNKENAIISNI